jgi:hypothetical protein
MYGLPGLPPNPSVNQPKAPDLAINIMYQEDMPKSEPSPQRPEVPVFISYNIQKLRDADNGMRVMDVTIFYKRFSYFE